MNYSSDSYEQSIEYKNVLNIPLVDDVNTNSTSSNSQLNQNYSTTRNIKVDGIKSTLSVFDVSVYVLQKLGRMTTMKLHKLLYYIQAWYLVWEEDRLFNEKIEAWANGPVVRELFNFHRGMYEISYTDIPIGNPSKLTKSQIENIDDVLCFYGNKSAQWLIDQTHFETPWRNARKGLTSNERGNKEILLEDMMEYYSSLK